jgi:hypothetical protein
VATLIALAPWRSSAPDERPAGLVERIGVGHQTEVPGVAPDQLELVLEQHPDRGRLVAAG